jgi:hypothetical protein
MTDLETFQMAIDLAEADLIKAAADYFELFPSLREFRIVISDDGLIQIHNKE